MLLQRARVAENRVKHRLSNGPLRAQSKVLLRPSILRRRADVKCRGYDSILLSVQHNAVNQGGTANKYLFVLDRESLSVKGVFILFFDSKEIKKQVYEEKFYVAYKTMA